MQAAEFAMSAELFYVQETAKLRPLILSLKEPMNAELVGKMSIGSKRHFAQVVQQLLVGCHGKLVKNRP